MKSCLRAGTDSCNPALCCMDTAVTESFSIAAQLNGAPALPIKSGSLAKGSACTSAHLHLIILSDGTVTGTAYDS